MANETEMSSDDKKMTLKSDKGSDGMSTGGAVLGGIVVASVVGGVLFGGAALMNLGNKITSVQVTQGYQGAQMNYLQAQTQQDAMTLAQIPGIIRSTGQDVVFSGQNFGVRDFSKEWHRHEYRGDAVRVNSNDNAQFDNAGGSFIRR